MTKKNGDPKTADVMCSNHCTDNDSKNSLISKWKISAARNELTAPQHIRLFDAVVNTPGILTWQVARTCGIGYAPARVFELNGLIARHGLRLISRAPAQIKKNQFSEPSRSHQWFLSVISGTGVV